MKKKVIHGLHGLHVTKVVTSTSHELLEAVPVSFQVVLITPLQDTSVTPIGTC